MWIDPATVLQLGIGAAFGAVFGAVFGGLSQIVVGAIHSRTAKMAIRNGLLAEVRACCTLAASHEHWLSEHLLAHWPIRSRKRQFLRHFRTPIWDAAIKEACALAADELVRLVAFHAYLGAIDGQLDSYLAEQDRLAMALGREDQAWTESILQAMRCIADTARQMCAAVGKYRDAPALEQLPLAYPDTFYHLS